MKNPKSLIHKPVLLKETIDYLDIKPGQLYIDATLGDGGHTAAILKKGGNVLGLDWDSKAVAFAKKRLSRACPNAFWIKKANFVKLAQAWQKKKLKKPAGILFDLGISSRQLAKAKRGFSFQKDAPLDMRMDPEKQTVSAADLLLVLSKKELYELISRLGEEQLAWSIAQAVVRTRARQPIKTTGQLRKLIGQVYRRHQKRSRRIDPATKTFQALRIAVNDELNNLEKGLRQAFKILKKGGRLVVISFHGGEDRIVKHFFKAKKEKGLGKVLTKKPITPTKNEIKKNPRSRSAKMRVLEKG